MKLSIRFLSVCAAALVLVSTVFTIGGCNRAESEGFALYLTRDDIPPASMGSLEGLALAATPLIAQADVVSYNQQSFELTLSAEAFQRIFDLKVPVRGKSFVVCVERKPIYWGAFWTPISSLSFDGVTIWKPMGAEQKPVVTFELGYPGSSFYSGQDPRNSPEVIQALQKAGKLTTRLSSEDISALPHSMKGYELYSWQDGGSWHFTLIIGTNRNKFLEEIVSNEEFVSAAGWENLRAVGVDKIKSLLGKLPEGEYVFWLAHLREEQGAALPKLELPPDPILNSIKEFALGRGLDFQVVRP